MGGAGGAGRRAGGGGGAAGRRAARRPGRSGCWRERACRAAFAAATCCAAAACAAPSPAAASSGPASGPRGRLRGGEGGPAGPLLGPLAGDLLQRGLPGAGEGDRDVLGPRELADQPVLLGGDGGGLALGGLGGRGRPLLRLPGEGGAADLVGLGLLRLVREDGGQRVGGGEALVVGLQRRRGALEGGVLVEHALGAVGAHHRVDGRQVTALLVGLRDQGTDPVALAGDGAAGTGRLGPGLAEPAAGPGRAATGRRCRPRTPARPARRPARAAGSPAASGP